MPLLFVFAALASAWVFHDARRRFPLYAVAAWAFATLISAPVVLPLYLIARTFTPLTSAKDAAAETTATEETGVAGLEETGAANIVAAGVEISDDTGEHVNTEPSQPTRAPLRLKRYAPSLLYAFALLSAGALYFYRDYRSFDAHLARAANARLRGRRDIAIREYRAALRLSDDAHTHKLLAVQLAEDGQTEAALDAFRAAERGGEPDELIPYRIAYALDALGRAGEAAGEYRKFLQGSSCARPSPDTRCAEASARLGQIRSGVAAP
jgi:tetratricopeptide (TPR) repeat protein